MKMGGLCFMNIRIDSRSLPCYNFCIKKITGRNGLNKEGFIVTGIPLIVAFVVAIVVMILLISKFKVHPFISIMLVSLVFAMVAGLELVKIPDIIGDGFSSTFKSIGIVIILGALVGTLLEKTGAALKMADCVVKLVGKNYLRFCAIGYRLVLLSRIFIAKKHEATGFFGEVRERKNG